MDYSIEQALPLALPMELLLLADPSEEAVKAYQTAPTTRAWAAFALDSAVLGLLLCAPVNGAKAPTMEVLNLAVHPDAQRQGMAQALLNRSFQYAKREGFSRMRIATADSSLGPLALYLRMGFEETGRDAGYFPRHYSEPIFEFGQQAIDRIILERTLSAPNPTNT